MNLYKYAIISNALIKQNIYTINHIKRKGFKLIEHIYLNRIQFVDPNYSRFRGINLTDKPKYSRADYYKNESLCHT